MKLREIENYGLKILNEKAKDGSMTVYSKFSETEKFNKNKRFYSRKIMSREVDRVQAKIASGQFLGQSDHGDSPQTFLKNVSHVVTGLEMVGNDGFATIKILNTEAGRNCQEIIRGKGRIGISTRSVGTVSATGVVQKDLRLLALDLVANPSVKDATIGKENILEGLNFEDEANENLEKEIQALEKESYLGACESGFKGSQADWEAQYSNSLREMMGLPKKEGGKTTVEKLTEEAIQARTFGYFLEAQAGGFMGDFNAWKEKYPQLVAEAEKPVQIQEKKKTKAPEKYKTTWDEVKQSGFRGDMNEWREKYPQMELIVPISPQKVVAEKTLREEAGRIFTKLSEENPNSSLTLDSVIEMLEKEEIAKADKRLRKRAIAIVSRDLDGTLSNEKVKEMVEMEIENLKKQREEMRERNWAAYEKLLQ